VHTVRLFSSSAAKLLSAHVSFGGYIVMDSKPLNFDIALSRCRHCGAHWLPAEGIVANDAYCEECATSRRAIAAEGLGLARLNRQAIQGEYLLPRSLRFT